MKLNIPIIVAVALVVAGLGVSFLTTRSLESPQAQLYRRIDEEVDRAQRMLAAYEPAGSRFLRLVTAAESQPADLLSAYNWQDNPIHASFEDRLQSQQRQLQAMAQKITQLGDDNRPQMPGAGSVQAYQQLEADLKRNETLIADALAIVRKAVNMREGSDDNAVSGSSHVSATRLEAILVWHQADLLAQRAAVQRVVADAQRDHFGGLKSSWQELETVIRSQSYEELAKAPGEPEPPAPESGPAPPESAPATPRAASPGEPETQPAEPTAVPDRPKTRTGKRGLVGDLARRLFTNKDKTKGNEGAEPVAPPKPDDRAPDAVGEKAPAEPEGVAPAPPKVDRPPTLTQRTARLQAKRAEAVKDIDEANKEVERLTGVTDELKTRIAEARAKAEEAEKRMLQIEEAGADPADPDALEKFTTAYKAAAEANRTAAQEAATLENGSIRNARPDTDDEDEMLTAPLVPADPNRDMEHERGLVALEGDLAAAQALVKTRTVLLAEIDRQLEQLAARRKASTEQLAELRASRATVRDEAVKVVRAAIAAALEADKLEAEAIALLDGGGKQAAARAQAAASKRISDARQLQDPESRNPRLDLVVKEGFVGGHAAALGGDLEYLRAMILADKAEDLERHQRMLQGAEQMGIRDAAEMLPEAAAGTQVAAWAFQPEAAGQAAKEARANAIAAARQAQKTYEDDANRELNDLWMLRANVAAVHYLLANLVDEPEAKTERENAAKQYTGAIQNREDRPEAELYRRIIDRLEQVPR